MPPVPPQMLPRIGIISPTGGERSNAAARRQSAARLPSLAPHGVGRGCNMNRHAEDSWRSHVHRTYTAQRVQSFKLQTANVGGRGGDSPRLSLGVPKGVFSSEREYPLCRAVALSAALSMQRRWRCNPPSPAREIKKGYPLREENPPFARQQRKELHQFMQRQRRCTPHPPQGRSLPPFAGEEQKPPSPGKGEQQKGASCEAPFFNQISRRSRRSY